MSIWAARWRSDHGYFIGGKFLLAKCILAIALCEAMPTLGSQTDKELKTVKTKDWCEVVALGPVAVFLVTQDHNARLGLKEHKLLILLNG
jgi:hypothetical protein